MTGPVIHCAFQYACPEDWNALTPAPDPAVRFCNICLRDVHFCHRDEDLKRHAGAGHCVAVPTDPSSGDRRALVGIPDPAFFIFGNEPEGKP